MRLLEIPSVLPFSLTEEEVNKLYNFNTSRLKPAWRDYLRNLLGKKNRYCVLKFTYQHEKKQNSNNKNSSLFKIKADCKLLSLFAL